MTSSSTNSKSTLCALFVPSWLRAPGQEIKKQLFDLVGLDKVKESMRSATREAFRSHLQSSRYSVDAVDVRKTNGDVLQKTKTNGRA